MKAQISLRSLRSFAANQFRANSCNSFLLLAFFAVNCAASTNDVASALQKGLFEEEANHNFPAAIEAYQGVISHFDEDRKLAATAIFRLGEIYRKQGKTNEANAQYERVVREFSDQSTLATLSQSYLAASTALSANAQTTNVNSESAPTSDEAEEVKKIRAMIRDSPDLINAMDQGVNGGNTPLHRAAELGHLIVARFLVENRADANIKNVNGETPLYLSALHGHKAVVELLLAHGANVQIPGPNVWTPLHAAARKGYRSIAKVLLAHGADINAKSKAGLTPLHLAVASGFKSVAELLLDHHAEVNSLASDTRNEIRDIAATPLLTVVARDDQNLGELLLAHGANPNATNAGGYAPLHFAARDGAQKLLELLLASKATVDAVNINGETPLDLAAGAGRTQVASTLLSHGADINASNPVDREWKGWTPLICAVSASQRQTTALLLKNKANPNAKTQNQTGSWARGFTPLLIACKISGESETVAALLDAKADPNLKTDFRLAPARAALDLPVASERKRILSLLLEHGADIEIRDDQGKTLLMLAAERKDKEIVELLLSHKADVNAKTDQNGVTALDYAVFAINYGGPPSELVPDIAKALLEAGANPNLQSHDGKTALNYVIGNSPPNATLGPVSSKARELLVAHGAILDLPRLDAIEVRRPDARFSKVIFSRGTNEWDQFTLFDLIGVQYQLLSASPGGEDRAVYGRFRSLPGSQASGPDGFAPETGLDFPDFKHTRIRRLKSDLQTWDERNVDIDAALASGDCSADASLQLGDQVEIPEADHVLNAKWEGLDEHSLRALKKCLTRQVSIIVKGQSNNVSLGPEILFKGSPVPNFPNAVVATFRVNKFVPLMIKPALIESKLLLASSDLSRIKLIRTDPATGQKRELIVDCSYDKPAPSVCLRDGDVIEVPDKP